MGGVVSEWMQGELAKSMIVNVSWCGVSGFAQPARRIVLYRDA